MITIDGSSGEGGGQILRTSLALSLVTGIKFSRHARTNVEGIAKFIPAAFQTEQSGTGYVVSLE
jgi:RNA 3'-terminal phosphate cyclase